MTNVLLINNNPEYLKEVLTQSGCNVECTRGGIEALKTLECEKFDIILLDVIIPNMDGWKILKKIRQNKNIPIIITTSIKDEQQMVLGLRSGADDYLIKPFLLQNLLARIEAVLRRTNGKTAISNDKIQKLLTRREHEVLKLVSEGANNKKIAEQLFLSEITVKSHISKIFKKLNVKNRTQAVLLYKKM